MLKKCGVLLGICLCGGVALGGGLQEQALAKHVLQTTNAGQKRFGYMRFYVPSDKIPQAPGLWERWFSSYTLREHQRALAFYLFNMYATTNSYKNLTPAQLTLNDVGVLDAFMLCQTPFDFKNASRFYEKNQQEVHAWLRQFFAGHTFPWAQPTAQEYTQWVKLLQTQPQRRRQAVYAWPGAHGLNVPVPAETAAWFVPFLEQALKQGRSEVILYDQAAPTLEDVDTALVPKQARRQRTYRWMIDECNYMSYLVAQMLTTDILQHPQGWGFTRVYTLTAYPQSGEFLTPARGTRFTLANGQPGLHWRYHTAVLAVAAANGTYVPVVLDTFLGGVRVLSVPQWLAHFSPQTVFTVTPFRRNETVENALKTPQQMSGDLLWVDGKSYHPAAVVK